MGSSLSSLPPLSPLVASAVTAEYHRHVCPSPCSPTALCSTSPLPPLSFSSLLSFSLPAHLPLSLSHLSTLYTVQSLSPTSDGRVSLPLLLDFLQWCEAKASEWRPTERQARLEAVFALHMATQAMKQGGAAGLGHGLGGGGGGGVGGLGTGGGGGGPGAAHLTQWILYSVLNDAGSGKGRATREPRGVSAAAASQMMNREQVRMVHEVSAGTAGAIWAGGRWTRADGATRSTLLSCVRRVLSCCGASCPPRAPSPRCSTSCSSARSSRRCWTSTTPPSTTSFPSQRSARRAHCPHNPSHLSATLLAHAIPSRPLRSADAL